MSLNDSFKSSGRRMMESIRTKYGDRKNKPATGKRPTFKPDTEFKQSMRAALRGKGKGRG